MEIICLEKEAFFALVEQVVQRMQAKQGTGEDRWISAAEAMRKLRISSRTTLQKLRDEGKIRFSQPQKKVILYDVKSIEEFINSHAKELF